MDNILYPIQLYNLDKGGKYEFMKEYLLSTNEYLEPAMEHGSTAYGILLMRLLLVIPGTNPLHPAMGVGIPKYRFISSDGLNELQTLIQEQISTYLPSQFIESTKVYLTLKENTKYLIITIIADETKYILDTEASGVPIELTDLVS